MMNRAKRIPWLVLVGVGLILVPPGCGPARPAARVGGPDGARTGRTMRMGMMPKLMGISYFNACRKGAEEAARALAIDLTFDGPNVDKVELQAQMIDEWIALGYDIIAVAPNDPEVIAPALRRARDAGILTLTWDADANPQSSGRALFVNQAPVEAVGNLLVDLMAGATGGRGKTVIVTGSATAPNQNAWMAVMERRLLEDYPGMTLLQTLVPEEDQNRARQMTLDVLNAHPDLAGAWGITSVALPAVAEAVHQAGRSGKVRVTGLSLPSTVRPYVRDGTIEQFVLWNPVDLGYLTVHVARQLADRTLAPGTSAFGRLRGIRVDGDQVILGPPKVFDRTNIDQYDF
jgi:ABC-type sugar transport system substrate-binding protein